MAHRAKVLGLFLLLFTIPAMCADFPGLGSDVSGRWTFKLTAPGGRSLGEAGFTQTGSQVTGWLYPNDGDRIAITGVVLNGKLLVTTHPEPRRVIAFDRCEVEIDGNRMKGAIHPGAGKIEFMKVREPRPSAMRRHFYRFGDK